MRCEILDTGKREMYMMCFDTMISRYAHFELTIAFRRVELVGTDQGAGLNGRLGAIGR
jgi:hypothetical protein